VLRAFGYLYLHHHTPAYNGLASRHLHNDNDIGKNILNHAVDQRNLEQLYTQQTKVQDDFSQNL
jgi:hypothetical protein